MKKLFITLFTLLVAVGTQAQLAWIEPDPTIATQEITIYVDLNKLDLSLEHNQLLINNPGPMYLWTWKPFEHPTGTPKANGTGDQPWKSSNELLKMTLAPEKGEKVWKYTMIPTEFYEVTATQVYASGIALIVKPKDGGGYGDPDIKTNDIILPVVPPKTDKGAVYPFPSVSLEKEITTIVYDNNAEKKVTMQNLSDATELYVYLKATAKDTSTGILTTYQPSSFFQVTSNPNLKLISKGNGQWHLYMLPQKFFGNPPTQVITEVEVRVRKKDWISDDDTSGDIPKIKFGCE
jgi:hypothetical protein